MQHVATLQKKPEEKKPERKRPEPIKLDENAELKDIVAALNQTIHGLTEYLEGTLSDKVSEFNEGYKRDTQARAQADEARKVKAFLDAHPDWTKHKERVTELYNKGHSAEEAYKLAKLEAGESVEEKPAKKSEAPPTPLPKRTSVKTDEGEDPERMRQDKPKTIKDAARAKFEEITQKQGSDIFEEPELDDEG